MARSQSFKPRFFGKGPNGRRLCVWCGVEVPPGRRRWCSQKCVTEMQNQHWPSEWRRQVIKRDMGVCQHCRFDAWKLDRVMKSINSIASIASRQLIRNHMARLGFKKGRSYVEADHIIPIVEGGSNTLDNGRTLCQLCHKAETKRLARRRALARRAKRAEEKEE